MNVKTLRKYIQDQILNDPTYPIEADQDLLLSEILNSLSVTLLITHLETTYDLKIPIEDVTLENFGTLNSIETYMGKRI